MSDKLLKEAASTGEYLYSLLGRGKDKLQGVLKSPSVTNAGGNFGEAGGRLFGALEGMLTHQQPPFNPAGMVGRSTILEGRGLQGRQLGTMMAPSAAGLLGGLATAYGLKKLLIDDKDGKEEQRDIYPDRYGYQDTY